jgi:hypothetical protein
MTEESQDNRNTVLVALDIAKKTHDAIIALPSGKTIKLRVPNRRRPAKAIIGFKSPLSQPLITTEISPTGCMSKAVSAS